MSGCIIKTKNAFNAYYYNNCDIFKRSFRNGIWSEPIVAADNARELFSIAQSENEMILYQLISGDICIARDGEHKVILKNSAPSCPNIVINSIVCQGRLNLVYNIVKNNKNMLAIQFQGEDRVWSEPKIIDNIEPFKDIIRLVELGAGHYIVLYCKKMPELQFGYREMDCFNIGEFKMVYASGYNIADFSYLITKEALHFVFLQNTNFKSRVIYVRRDANGLSKPLTLFEGFNIKNCLIGIVANKLNVWWSANRVMTYTQSFDFGKSFNKIQTERSINTDYIAKAQFSDRTPNIADNYIFNEVYVATDRPYMPYFLNDISEQTNKNDVENLKKEIERLKRKLEEK